MGRRRVRRLIRKLGLSAIRPKRRTSRSHPEHKIYPYLLRHMTIDQPNLVWSADITYIPMRRGFLYLVAFIDRSTRRVLSWRLSNTLTVGFSVEALGEAIGEISRHFLPSTAIPRFQNSLAIHAGAAWPGPWQHAAAKLAFSLAFLRTGEIQAEQVENSLLNGGWFGENRNRQCIVEAHGVACEVGQIGQ